MVSLTMMSEIELAFLEVRGCKTVTIKSLSGLYRRKLCYQVLNWE